jgi:hypothetical protein
VNECLREQLARLDRTGRLEDMLLAEAVGQA